MSRKRYLKSKTNTNSSEEILPYIYPSELTAYGERVLRDSFALKYLDLFQSHQTWKIFGFPEIEIGQIYR